MKNLIRIAGIGIVAGIGVNLGYWLWDNILEDKVDDMYDKHQKKKLKKYPWNEWEGPFGASFIFREFYNEYYEEV